MGMHRQKKRGPMEESPANPETKTGNIPKLAMKKPAIPKKKKSSQSSRRSFREFLGSIMVKNIFLDILLSP
jgi:hypothetical protein